MDWQDRSMRTAELNLENEGKMILMEPEMIC
jgi:hypothetical protein